MKTKLFDYIERDNFIYNLSGLTKLLGFLLMTFAVMFSFDIRCILIILAMSFFFFRVSEISFRQVRLLALYVSIFLVVNFFLTFLFSPTYGVEIYGTSHEIFTFTERYVLTKEQMLYQITKTSKYASVIPLGLLFFLTTNPSEFASSLNRIKCSYKGSYAVSLTLRYFPDLVRDFQDISLAQQSRGLDMSKKEKVSVRAKNVINICVPLIFSTLDRIEMVSNAMDLRSFGKQKKRTWYVAIPLKRNDYLSVVFCGLVFILTICISIFINHSRFWNPFI